MCGIFGMSKLSGSKLKAPQSKEIIKRLALGNMSRGRNATGLVFINNSKATLFKHNVPANRFIELDNYEQVLEEECSDDKFLTVIGHTRMQTQGSHENPNNNHPINTGSIIGVHNGQISNDSEMFRWLSNESHRKVQRIAEVDSEIIFSMVNYLSNQIKTGDQVTADNPTTISIRGASRHLSGSYACALIDTDNPKCMWVFRNHGPLTVHHFLDEGILIFSSAESCIEDAVEGMGFKKPEKLAVDQNSGVCFNVRDNEYARFTLSQGARSYQIGV